MTPALDLCVSIRDGNQSMITTPDTGRDPLLAISNGIVRVFKDVAGRGPRRARASFAGSDALVVVLEQTLTTMERNLVQMGEHRRTHELRLHLQATVEAPTRAIVDDVMKRRTSAFATVLDPYRCVAT